jgi:hypothetical protein
MKTHSRRSSLERRPHERFSARSAPEFGGRSRRGIRIKPSQSNIAFLVEPLT